MGKWKYYLNTFAVCILLSLGLCVKNSTAAGKPTLKKLINDANLLVEQKEYESAVRNYNMAWKLYNSPDAAYNLAVVYDHEMGFKAKAIYYYKKFLTLAPDAPEAPAVQQWLKNAQEVIYPQLKTDSAIKKKGSSVLDRIMEDEQDKLLRLGKKYLVKGRYEQAIKVYREALIVHKSAPACYNLALIYDYDLKYKNKAIYYYQRFLKMSPESAGIYRVPLRITKLSKESLQDKGILFKPRTYTLRAIKAPDVRKK